ncbi:hypothetical protein L6452_09855 [Arctium lappa]|uniref:Uncharacterized protein n=1 Tax=Arctium lappa TaxID=4217 RepID=A0ACB9DL63_ARCLA|nr:hypothetical protein L6452_09855 [Arctium lappa]
MINSPIILSFGWWVKSQVSTSQISLFCRRHECNYRSSPPFNPQKSIITTTDSISQTHLSSELPRFRFVKD